MKLEFLDDISDGGKYPQVVSEQLIRLYDFDPTQASLLKAAIQAIIAGKEEIDLSSLEFIEEMNCKLTLQATKRDKGITTRDKYHFVCALSNFVIAQIVCRLALFDLFYPGSTLK